MTEFAIQTAEAVLEALRSLIVPALVFLAIGLIVKRGQAITDMRRAIGETRINLSLLIFDTAFVTPLVVAALVLAGRTVQQAGLTLMTPVDWAAVPAIATAFLVVFAGDFAGYLRHRFEHWGPLWPAHAIHHSDTEMTWLTIYRFHPVNRLTTAVIDTALLAMLGFPTWALVLNNLVRHYYGAFIHMNLPWTYGPLGRVLVSPAMHRWHHVLEGPGVGCNFATVFSIFDRAFGTLHVPGACNVPLGVGENMGRGVIGQLWHPFRTWGRSLARQAGFDTSTRFPSGSRK